MVALALIVVQSCKKKDETTPTPVDNTTYGTVEITTVNDTVDFSTAGTCTDWSIGMDFDSLHTDLYSTADYKIKSNDTNCFFTGNRGISFAAGNNNKLFLADNLGGAVKKYTQGQKIDYNSVMNSASSSGSVDAIILQEGMTTSFNLNETFYLGTAFLQNGQYYNGWVKVKTLNNYYSCIILSYGVCKTANTAIKAE